MHLLLIFILVLIIFCLSLVLVIVLIEEHIIKKIVSHQKTSLILTTTINNFKIKILTMELQVNNYTKASLALIDSDTQAVITDAVFSNVNYTSSDPNTFTCDTNINSNGAPDIIGKGQGTATLTVDAIATYMDSVSKISTVVHKTVTETIIVTPTVVVKGQNTSMTLSFSTPAPVA